jgi:hypothetical protein
MDAEGPHDSAGEDGVDVAAVAEQLYGLLPAEFTAARDSEVKRAKADGDKPAAATIAGLRRPSLAAWVVNALVRHRRDEVEQLLTLGEALRTAQQGLAGDELRALARQRQQVLSAVGRQARALARELGQPVSEDVGLEVEQTLGAAMADPAVAEAVRSGRLVSPTSYAGLGLDIAAPPAPKPRLAVVKQGKSKTADGDEQARRRDEEARRREAERRAAEVEQARRDADEAEHAWRDADEAAREAQQRHATAEASVESARAHLEELQAQLQRAEHDLADATRAERAVRRDVENAARLADLARRGRDRARDRLQRLDPPD